MLLNTSLVLKWWDEAPSHIEKLIDPYHPTRAVSSEGAGLLVKFVNQEEYLVIWLLYFEPISQPQFREADPLISLPLIHKGYG